MDYSIVIVGTRTNHQIPCLALASLKRSWVDTTQVYHNPTIVCMHGSLFIGILLFKTLYDAAQNALTATEVASAVAWMRLRVPADTETALYVGMTAHRG
jgi:hypothetical protein